MSARSRARRGDLDDGPAPPLPENDEPTTEWAAAMLGISLEDAAWLMVLYRFETQDPDDPWDGRRRRYVCEAL